MCLRQIVFLRGSRQCSLGFTSASQCRFGLHLRHKSVATPGERLDEARLGCGIAEHFAQLVHSSVQAVIEVHERIRGPQTIAQFLACDHGTCAFQQHSENREGLILEAQPASLLAKLARPQVGLVNAKAENPRVLGGGRVGRHAA